MAKYLPLPDGSSLKVPDDMSYEEAMAKAQAKFPDLFTTPGAGPASGFMPALKAGVSGLKSGVAALAGKTGIMDEEAAAKYMQEQEAYQKKTFKPTATFGEAPLTKTAELLGGSLPYMAAPIVAGGVAASAPVTGALGLGALGASVLGGTAAGAASAAQFTGSNIQRQMAEGKKLSETDLGAAALAAIPQAALDVVSLRMLPGIRGILAAGGKEVSEATAKRIAEQGIKDIAKDYALSTGKAMGTEGVTEAAQQVLERAQAGLNLTDPKAREEYFDSFIGGAVLGGAISPIGRRLERGAEQTQQEAAAAKTAARTATEAAAAEEAAKNTPEALTQLDTQYQDATRRMRELQAVVAAKPTKASTPEEKQAYADAKQELTRFQKEEFAPIRSEYSKRKDAISAMQDAQLADIEQKAAEGQPTAAATTPSGVSPVPMPKLMERYDQLRDELDTVETQLAAGPSIEEQTALSQQRQALKQQTDAYGQLLQERGGVAMTAAEHTQAVKEADAALAREDAARKKLLNEGAFDEADKQAGKIAELMQKRQELVSKRPLFQETMAYKESAPGETQQMFAEEEMPAPAEQKPLAYVGPEGKEITPPAPAPETAAPVTPEVAPSKPEQKLQTANEELAAAVESKNEEATNEALKKINEAEAERSRAAAPKAETLKGKLDTSIWDIFSPHNVIATAVGNNDKRTLATLARVEDRKKLDALESRSQEEARIRRLLDERLGLGGAAISKKSGEPLKSVKLERADLFDDMFNQKAKSAFKNGNSQEFVLDENGDKVLLQDIYDKQGVAAVEMAVVMDKVRALRKKVEMPQGNAKTSLYQKLVDLSAEHEALLEQKEAGLASATMGEKVAGAQAKLGKGEAPAAREMDAAEKYQLERKIKALEAQYNAVLGKVAPIRKQIDETYSTLYKQTPLETVETEREAKKALLLPKAKEKALADTERDTLETAALKLGRETDKYKAFVAGLQQRLDVLEQKYGADSKQVAEFRKYSMSDSSLDEKALTLGKSTPEYQAALKEQLAATKKELGVQEFTPEVSMSRTARTQARIAAGDVRKEAETSATMRELAVKLGQQMPEYEKLAAAQVKRRAALIAKYGKADPAVAAFGETSYADLQEKALELGKTTPEYKATLKEQIEVVREALAGSKQTLKSKRGTQTTRKVSLAKKEEATGSPESRAVGAKRHVGKAMSVAEQERVMKEVNDSEGGTAYRIEESPTEGVVDAAQAQTFIDGVQKNLPANVKFVYAATSGKIPVRLLTMMAEDGIDPTVAVVKGAVFSDGTVLVVGDQHSDLLDLEKTVMHELVGHYGIDTVIGMQRLGEYAQKTDLNKLAEEIGGAELLAEVERTIQAQKELGSSVEVQNLQALREIIAHTEEARVTEAFRNKAQRWIKELIGMVRSGMRQLGFSKMPAMSSSDIFYALRKSRKAFENKTIGVYRDAKGQTAFRIRRTPGEFDATPEPSAVNKLLGNVMGLAGRMQLVDKFAAVSEAFRKGMSAGVLTDVEASNAEFLLRFGEHRSQLAGQALTNGPLSLVTTKTDKGIEHTYKSTKGPNALLMAEALNKGGFTNDSEAEGMFTLYLAGARAKQVGWEKLNYTSPDAEKAKYQRMMAILGADKKKEDAIKEAAKIYQEYNNGQLDFLVQTGELTAAKAAELKAITYVPFYRVNAQGEVQLMIDREHPVRIGNIKDEPQLQQLVGDNKQIMPIFTSMVQNTFMLTNLGLRNQSVKETAFMLRKIGIASRIGQGPGPKGADTVRFKKNGVDMHVVIDTDMYGIPAEFIVKGMEGIKTTIPVVVKLLGMPADVLRQFVTRAPTYAIRQMIRDPLNAWLTTGTDAVPVLSSFKELASMVAGRSETERTLMEAGAVSSNVFTGDERDMGKVLREITSGKAGWTKLMAKADAFALQGDTATRAVIYKDSILKGMSHQQALLRSVESMNFSRRGLSPSIQMLSTMIPFFNAQIQGLDVLYRAFKGDMPYNEQLKIREKLFRRGLMLAVGTMAYAAAMQDDEAYKRAKPEERYGNWFLYVPGFSEPVRVPIPFELGYLFKSLPEAVYNVAMSDDKASAAAKGIGTLLAQSNPFALPQAIKPLTEVVLGKSFFSGDIESEREKGVMATQRYRDSSTEVSKLIGSVTGEAGLSPIKIDYLIRGYTGGLGIALVQLANPLLNTETVETAKPSMKPSKMPFIGGLFQPVEGRGTLDAAYDKMLEIQQTKGTYNKLIEEGKRAEAQEFVQQYATQLALVSTSGAVQKALGEMAKQERAIKASKTMTTEQKDVALERLDKLKVAYARQFLTQAGRTKPQ